MLDVRLGTVVTALAGVATELAWTAAHVALYPLGTVAERRRSRDERARFVLDDLRPGSRGLLLHDVVAAGTPVLLVHGLADNRSVFAVLRRALEARGFGRVLSFCYSPLTNDVRAAAAELADEVERVLARTGYDAVHLVGHSLGGIVARYYVQRLGGASRVTTVCTLGSPHAGTWSAHLLPGRLARQLRPGSDLLAELDAPAPGCGTRFVAFWSDLDHVVVPHTSARLDHPDLRTRNVAVRGVGHTSLPVDRGVAHEVVRVLAGLDAAETAGEVRQLGPVVPRLGPGRGDVVDGLAPAQ